LEICSKFTLAVIRAVAQLWIVRHQSHAMKSKLKLLDIVLAMLSVGIISTLTLVLVVRPHITHSEPDPMMLHYNVSLASSFLFDLAVMLGFLSVLSLISLFIVWRLRKGQSDA
jgi:hypothetical protein